MPTIQDLFKEDIKGLRINLQCTANHRDMTKSIITK